MLYKDALFETPRCQQGVTTRHRCRKQHCPRIIHDILTYFRVYSYTSCAHHQSTHPGSQRQHVVEHLPEAQHSAVRPAQSSTARTCRSERDNASKQTELPRAIMSPSIYSCGLQNEQSKSARHNRNVNPLTGSCKSPVISFTKSSYGW